MAEHEFENRVALVTGGSRGIGRAICLQLARSGARVAVNYSSNHEAAVETQRIIADKGGTAVLYQADVGSLEETNAMFDRIEAEFGAVELLVSNAGIARSGDSLSMDSEIWREIMQVNLHGTFHCVWRAKEKMMESKYGRIVCVSSILGQITNRISSERMIAYGTSKAAIIGFVRNCAAAFGPHVRVNSVAPGYVDTDMTANASDEARAMLINTTPLKRIGHVNEIAEMVHFQLSDRSSFTTGQTHVCSGGLGI